MQPEVKMAEDQEALVQEVRMEDEIFDGARKDSTSDSESFARTGLSALMNNNGSSNKKQWT